MPSPRARAPKPSPARRPRVAGRITPPSKDTVAQDEARDPSTTSESAPESADHASKPSPTPRADTAAETSAESTESAVDTADPETQVMPAVIGAEPQDAAPATESESTSDKPARKLKVGKKSAAKSTSDTAAETEAEWSGASAVGARSGGSWLDGRTLTIALGAVAVVFLAAATVFGVFAYRTSNDASASNSALADPVETSSVIGQVTNAVQTVFSYNYTDTAKTEQAAQTLLTGKAVDQYNQLFGQVKQLAPQQKLVDTVTVQQAGVKMLDGDRAEVLLFLDQRAVRTDNGQSNGGPSQMIASAQKINGVWKINNFTML